MAESGMEAKEEEQEESVRAELEQLAQEELGETKEVESLKKICAVFTLESLRKPSLFLLYILKVRDSTLNEMKRWLQLQVCQLACINASIS